MIDPAGWLVFDGAKIVAKIGQSEPAVPLVSTAFGADTRGFVLTLESPPLTPSGEHIRATDSTYLVLVSRGTGRVDTIGRMRPEPMRGSVPPVTALNVYEYGLLSLDGWVAVARLDPYRVDWRSPDGRWIKGAPLPVPAEPLDAAEKAAMSKRLPAGRERETFRWPPTVPPFNVGAPTILTMDGKVLIRRQRTVRNPGTRYDVVNRKGELEKQLLLPANERILGFGRASVYVVVQDADGLETLRRHPWP